MRKKKKEAEREGEASAIMVSQGVLPAPSPLEGAFWGRGQLLRGSRDLPLLTHLKKKKARGREEAAEGIWRVSFLQRERLRDVPCFVYSSLQS